MGTVRDPPPFRRGQFVAQPIPRFEDRRFITGRGRYTDDIKLDEAAAMAFEGAAGLRALTEIRLRSRAFFKSFSPAGYDDAARMNTLTLLGGALARTAA
jgi:hypothetical protein